ncbi:MAG TPA: hypothetical protein PLK30_12895 [Blastocatellia bacterium]|nr:hypothetical protein [Blastocatellia bacterium]
MPLRTRENPESGIIEVQVNDDWVDFDSYRKKQIDDAYQSSVKFLRDRLGEDAAGQIAQNTADDSFAEPS